MGQVQTEVRFVCPECEEKVSVLIYVPEVDWSHDSPGDSLSEDDIDIECPSCKFIFDAQVQNSPSHCAVELSEYPEVIVEADDAVFAIEDGGENDLDWLNLYPPDEPFAVFKDAQFRLHDIVAEYGIGGRGSLPHSSDVVNRMVFASAIAAMEAFLGDLLIRTVFAEDTALTRILEHEQQLKKIAIPLNKIQKNPNIVVEQVREYLAGLLYHDLAKVFEIYRLVLQVDIFPSKEIKERLMRAVKARHDIVHRNGKNKEGEVLDIQTNEVVNVLDDLLTFATHVHREVMQATVAMGFEDLTLTPGKQ